MQTFITYIFLAAATTTTILAHPTTTFSAYEVVPGPGMPSLHSLGLTSANLHANTDLTRRSTASVICRDESLCTTVDVNACMQYLSKVQTCSTNSYFTTLCTSGTCSFKVYGPTTASSTDCSNLIDGAQLLLSQCATDGASVAGVITLGSDGNDMGMIVNTDGLPSA